MFDPWGDDTGYEDVDEEFGTQRWSKPNRERSSPERRKLKKRTRPPSDARRAERVESRDGTFRCKQCKTIVGVPISGGRHRNHCPLCLFSRHVDLKTPGDRAATCRSMMRAIGLFTRGDGEQVLMHECLGCSVVKHNRVAADDNVIEIMRLSVVRRREDDGESLDERTA